MKTFGKKQGQHQFDVNLRENRLWQLVKKSDEIIYDVTAMGRGTVRYIATRSCNGKELIDHVALDRAKLMEKKDL